MTKRPDVCLEDYRRREVLPPHRGGRRRRRAWPPAAGGHLNEAERVELYADPG